MRKGWHKLGCGVWLLAMVGGACSDDGALPNGGDAGDGSLSGGEPPTHGGASSGSGGATSGGAAGHFGEPGELGGAGSPPEIDGAGAGGEGPLIVDPAGGAGAGGEGGVGGASSEDGPRLLGKCEPRGLSKDGKTVLADEGIWTLEGGWRALPDLAGGAVSNTPRALSPDGKVVFGNSSSALGDEMYRWTAASGIQGLGVLHLPFASSLDGSVAAGWIEVFEDSPRPFRWTTSGGFVDLGAVDDFMSMNGFMDAHLSEAGDVAQFSLDRDRASWTANEGLEEVDGLRRVTAMSADGSKLALLYAHSNGDTISTEQCFVEDVEAPQPAPAGAGCPLQFAEVWVAVFDYDDSGTRGVGVQVTDDEYLAFYWTEDTGMWKIDSLLPSGFQSYTTPLTESLDDAYPTRPYISGDGKIVLARAKNGDCFLAEVEIPTNGAP